MQNTLSQIHANRTTGEIVRALPLNPWWFTPKYSLLSFYSFTKHERGSLRYFFLISSAYSKYYSNFTYRFTNDCRKTKSPDFGQNFLPHWQQVTSHFCVSGRHQFFAGWWSTFTLSEVVKWVASSTHHTPSPYLGQFLVHNLLQSTDPEDLNLSFYSWQIEV